jgi:hypothetical protein
MISWVEYRTTTVTNDFKGTSFTSYFETYVDGNGDAQIASSYEDRTRTAAGDYTTRIVGGSTIVSWRFYGSLFTHTYFPRQVVTPIITTAPTISTRYVYTNTATREVESEIWSGGSETYTEGTATLTRTTFNAVYTTGTIQDLLIEEEEGYYIAHEQQYNTVGLITIGENTFETWYHPTGAVIVAEDTVYEDPSSFTYVSFGTAKDLRELYGGPEFFSDLSSYGVFPITAGTTSTATRITNSFTYHAVELITAEATGYTLTNSITGGGVFGYAETIKSVYRNNIINNHSPSATGPFNVFRNYSTITEKINQNWFPNKTETLPESQQWHLYSYRKPDIETQLQITFTGGIRVESLEISTLTRVNSGTYYYTINGGGLTTIGGDGSGQILFPETRGGLFFSEKNWANPDLNYTNTEATFRSFNRVLTMQNAAITIPLENFYPASVYKNQAVYFSKPTFITYAKTTIQSLFAPISFSVWDTNSANWTTVFCSLSRNNLSSSWSYSTPTGQVTSSGSGQIEISYEEKYPKRAIPRIDIRREAFFSSIHPTPIGGIDYPQTTVEAINIDIFHYLETTFNSSASASHSSQNLNFSVVRNETTTIGPDISLRTYLPLLTGNGIQFTTNENPLFKRLGASSTNHFPLDEINYAISELRFNRPNY